MVKVKAVVLGSGMVGSVIAADLAVTMDVMVVDYSEKALAVVQKRSGDNKVAVVQADLSKPEKVLEVVKGADVMICALPGFLGFNTLKTVIEAAAVKLIADISFMPEDTGLLHDLAKEKGVTVCCDIGIAPGISHMMLGNGASKMKHVKNASCYVGGLPRIRTWPFEYKAPFSPIDVIEEYIRPSYVIENNETVVHEALSGVEMIDDPELGTVEAFYSDGLRSALRNIKCDNMWEKTYRYPGQPQFLKALRASGYFSYDPITIKDVNGNPVTIRPVDVSAALLFPMWTYGEGEVDLLSMTVVVEGDPASEGGKNKVGWTVFDELDTKTNYPAMSRTTGYPCASVARMLVEGVITDKGVIFPEELGKNQGFFDRVIGDLKDRGIAIKETVF